ncbi:hypothetical protein BRC77_14375 [Halobacteriales archaeon QH_8_64_26]|nr:MAG: hypothetical protein BRC77_14375 [Halobacteriales archaeon QH_8_64_26]
MTSVGPEGARRTCERAVRGAERRAFEAVNRPGGPRADERSDAFSNHTSASEDAETKGGL